MKELTGDMFIVPTIALMVAIGLFIYFYNRIIDKRIYIRFLMGIVIISFLLNSIWELAHSPLYLWHQYDFKHVSICVLASLADTVIVLILIFLFGLVFKNVFWVNHLTISRTIVLALVGAIGAIIGEMWHTSKGDWAYADYMPLIPWLGVGVSPVLQFTILPLIIFVVNKKVFKSISDKTFLTIK